MRVVAGKYKGMNLDGPKGNKTRPTDNKIKEAVFDMLYPINPEGIALDLFSGSGQMGIEFLSRGLSLVYFNEADRMTYQILMKNLEKTKATNFEASKAGFRIALESYRSKAIKFDYIFLDPPYDTDYLEKSIEFIVDNELLNQDGIVITESDKDLKFDEEYGLYMLKEKTYGRKFVNIYIR